MHRAGRRGLLSALLPILLIAMGLAAASAPRALAVDQVWLKPSGVGESGLRLSGEIADYTGSGLTLRTGGKRERRIPAAEIDRIETPRSAEHEAADELFAQGDFAAALPRYRQALEASREPRAWVRRQILAQVVWCQRNLGQVDQAGEHFRVLMASDPETPLLDCMPLAWTNEEASPDMLAAARKWMAETAEPATVLMGASHLLESEDRPAALAALKGLLAAPDRRVAWLAFAQLWRAGTANATAEQRASFAAKIEAADETLRAGASYILGTALSQHDPEAAAIAFLKVPLVYPREYELSAAALLAAGQCLETASRKEQAAGLYREIATRYGRSASAEDARRRLESLVSTRATGDNK